MKLKLLSGVLAIGLFCAIANTAEARSFFSFSLGGSVMNPPVYESYVVQPYYAPAPGYMYVPGPMPVYSAPVMYSSPVPVMYSAPVRVVPGGAVMYPRPVMRSSSASFSWFFGR